MQSHGREVAFCLRANAFLLRIISGRMGRHFVQASAARFPTERDESRSARHFAKTRTRSLGAGRAYPGSANTRYYAEFQLTQARAKVPFRL